MHAQEVAQEVLAPEEHASGKNLEVTHLQEVQSARSSKSYDAQEAMVKNMILLTCYVQFNRMLRTK